MRGLRSLGMTVTHRGTVRIRLRWWWRLSTPQRISHAGHTGAVIRHRVHVIGRGRLVRGILRLWLLLLHRVGCPMPRIWTPGISRWSHAPRRRWIVSIVGVHFCV